ncbi:MAG: sigma-70 family RNA polymerase sigma factor [Thermomicrobiales bacterium]
MARDKLVQQAQRGDYRALEELCRREWKPVYAIAYRSLRNVSEAQDLTQEVFLRALRSLDRYEDTGAPFRAYLATIARNLIRDRWRKHRPQLVDLDVASHVPGTNDVPEDRALETVDREELHRALRYLSDDHQTVIQLRINEGLSAAEVGEIMGRSPAAVRQLQYRALTSLRTHLQQERGSQA